LAQVAVYSALISQATSRGYSSQGLAGTETSLISAYSFNGVITDLNTTNANNLTANGSAVATSPDSPFGGQADGAISSTLDYAIITKVATSTVTVQVPEGNTIPTSGGVSAVVYSSQKVPFGFVAAKAKWTLQVSLLTSNAQASPTANVWYNIAGHSLLIPTGEWDVSYTAVSNVQHAGATYLLAITTLSTSPTTDSDKTRFTVLGSFVSASSVEQNSYHIARDGVAVTAPITYYLNLSTGTAGATQIRNLGASTPSKITAENALL